MSNAASAASTVTQKGATSGHLALVGGEHHQRHDRERQLQAQNHLAENQQLRRP
jgi:hypothetical protein